MTVLGYNCKYWWPISNQSNSSYATTDWSHEIKFLNISIVSVCSSLLLAIRSIPITLKNTGILGTGPGRPFVVLKTCNNTPWCHDEGLVEKVVSITWANRSSRESCNSDLQFRIPFTLYVMTSFLYISGVEILSIERSVIILKWTEVMWVHTFKICDELAPKPVQLHYKMFMNLTENNKTITKIFTSYCNNSQFSM